MQEQNHSPMQHVKQTIPFEWGQIEWLVSGVLGNSRAMTFGRVTIQRGKSNPRHRHPNCDEVLYLIQGRLEHTLGDEKVTLEPGDTISIPIGVAHNARSLGPEDAVMVVAYSNADRQTEDA